MGGYGSTRWGCHTPARTVDGVPALRLNNRTAHAIRTGPGHTYTCTWTVHSPVGQQRQNSIGMAVHADGQAVTLRYRATGGPLGDAGRDIAEVVLLARAWLRYGERLYWCCPGCGRRVGVLYLLGATFRCRRCHRLTYRSCQESDGRVSHLLAELEANPALLDDLLSNAGALDPTTLMVLLKAQERLLR